MRRLKLIALLRGVGEPSGSEKVNAIASALSGDGIPMVLKHHGLIDGYEEESFNSFLIEEVADEEVFLRHVEVLVRRAHGRLHRLKDVMKLQGGKSLSDETG